MMSEAEAMGVQRELSQRVIQHDDLPRPVRIIAGADVEYDKHSDRIAGAIVLLDADTKAVLDAATHVMTASFPYIPGLFSFREMPPLLEAYQKLRLRPDVIVCDGHGVAHPRRFGLACHLGLELNVPTVGCGKTRLIGRYDDLALERGATAALLDEMTGDRLGLALRTQTGINPLFVSVGHRVSLGTAAQLVLSMCDAVRLPETTRQADKYAREALEAAIH
ncbi:deoxyribonuclease V [Hymenobacter sp. BT186]|uniref:Endonuclease V n=1 Tax=Hymenobacter telluris TaxID=2816474 RepID=A0A939EXH1_9BACT|nr:deoxyribonuclease V [Hymenobacter telluris]MBO0358415.1 deoxyribonuclease V [Hymenobacter telluris]MBW3374441.1 deoxyribonuclease V [Hymenobacter norwichensis]